MATFDVTTVSRVLDWLGESELGQQAEELQNRIVPQVTTWVETYLANRVDRVERTAYPRPQRKGFTRYLYFPAAPIDDSKTVEIIYAADRDFAATDAIDPETYALNAEGGFAELDVPIAGAKPRTIRFKATAGLADKFEWASGDAAGLVYLATDLGASGATRGDWDTIVQAATMIAGETWKRRKTIGRKGTRDRTGTIEYQAELAIPKHAFELLAPHRRRRFRG